MSVIVRTKSSCDDCQATLAALEELGVEVSVVDMTASIDELEEALFTKNAWPTVITPYGDSWTGHQLDKIEALAEDLAQERQLRQTIIQRRMSTVSEQLTI